MIDGKSLFGQYIAHEAMMMAINKAKETGIAAVGTFNSNHFGITGYYSDLAIRNDMIGIVICNTEPGVAPLGGKKAILGTNPIAIGIPSETYIAVDMATAVSARGKILEAKRKGEEIPPNTAIDKDGNPTTDPEAALEGSILPFGGVKGYALSFMIEIMTGPLVNAAFGTKVTGTAGDYKEDCNKGDLFVAINPEKFVSIDAFKEQVEEFVTEIRESGNTFIPGDLEVRRIAENLGFEPISETIYIQDVATEDEMAMARNIRVTQGKHVIPVPTFAIKKDFSGYLLDPLQIFKSTGKGNAPYISEKSIVRPTFSYLGNFTISDNVFKQIIEYVADNTEGIYKIHRTIVKKHQGYNDGIFIYTELIIQFGYNVMDTVKKYKTKVLKEIDKLTSMNVLNIDIIVKGVNFKNKK